MKERSAGGAGGGRVGEHVTDQAFTGIADQQRAAPRAEPAGMAQQGRVVFKCLAETDARVESDPLPVDAGRNQRAAAGGQIREDLNAYQPSVVATSE